MTLPALGTVIEYADGERHHLAYVLETGRSLLVVTPGAAQPRISRDAVTFERILSWPDDLSVDDARDRLVALERQVCGLEQSGNLEDAWELLSAEEGRGVSISELTDLVFGRVDPATQLATERLLRRNTAWFKRVGDAVRPRARAKVDALLHQAAAEAAAAREREQFAADVATIARMTKAPRAERAAATDALAVDPACRARLLMLEDFAILGDEHPQARAAAELLDGLAASGMHLRGRGVGRAFHLLVDLGVFGVHENLMLRRRGALTSFTDDEIDVAASLEPVAGWDRQRRDLRHLNAFTIDGASTRDIDDALSVEFGADGSFRVGIHITDPAAVIVHDSAADHVARRRGTSIYLPDGVIPMLPPVLSEGALSLVPGADRAAMSFLVDYDAEGEPCGYSIQLTQVRSRRKLTYDEVDAILVQGGDPLARELETLDAVAGARIETRLQGGAVIMEIPETKITTVWSDADALERVEVKLVEDTPARVLVREAMVLAGELAGDFCGKHGVPVLYRAQTPPDDLAQEEALAGRRLEVYEAFAARRHMRRAELVLQPAAHFGLGVPSYVQVTSPIRRYSDLLSHRQIAAAVRGEPLPVGRQELVGLAAQIDALCADASVIERERQRYWSLVYLRQFKNEHMDAVVVDFADDRHQRAVVLVGDALIQGVVPVRRTQVATGARVKVKIESLNPRRNVLILAVVS